MKEEKEHLVMDDRITAKYHLNESTLYSEPRRD